MVVRVTAILNRSNFPWQIYVIVIIKRGELNCAPGSVAVLTVRIVAAAQVWIVSFSFWRVHFDHEGKGRKG